MQYFRYTVTRSVSNTPERGVSQRVGVAILLHKVQWTVQKMLIGDARDTFAGCFVAQKSKNGVLGESAPQRGTLVFPKGSL